MSKTITIGTGKGAMEVSPIGFGAMGLTAFYGEITPEAEGIKVLRKAFDLGVKHFDTAQMYKSQDKAGNWHYNEEVVGKFLKTLTEKERKSITVATKLNPFELPDFTEDGFRKLTKKSMERLGVKCIDLYYFHRIYDPKKTPVSVWMNAAKKLVEEGLIARIGLSEASAAVIKEANAIYPITCVQQEWSLFARDLEESIVPMCKQLGVGIIAYSPIGRGFLAGSFSKEYAPNDWRATVPYMNPQNFDRNLKLLDEFKAFCKKKGCTLGQMALAWVMAKGSVPIPGTTKIHHLEDNMGALNVKLTAEEIKYLGDLGNKVTGARGDEGYMKATFHANA